MFIIYNHEKALFLKIILLIKQINFVLLTLLFNNSLSKCISKMKMQRNKEW